MDLLFMLLKTEPVTPVQLLVGAGWPAPLKVGLGELGTSWFWLVCLLSLRWNWVNWEPVCEET